MKNIKNYWKIGRLAGLLLLIGVSSGLYQFNKKVPTLDNKKADHVLSADELFNAFDLDETKASLLYLDKVIEVVGEVVRVKNSESQSNVILKATNALAGGINCSFDDSKMSMEVGDKVIVKCLCQGYLMHVVMNNCKLI